MKSPQLSTIFEFERFALSAFKSIWDKDSSRLIEDNKQKERNKPKDGQRVYEADGLRIAVSNIFTE